MKYRRKEEEKKRDRDGNRDLCLKKTTLDLKETGFGRENRFLKRRNTENGIQFGREKNSIKKRLVSEEARMTLGLKDKKQDSKEAHIKKKEVDLKENRERRVGIKITLKR